MDRSREARRTGMTVANGLSRRRPRSTSLRDSPEEDGQVELQETVRLRDRVQKQERDRGLLNRNKRTRGDRYVQGSNRDEVEESSEESVDHDEDDYEEEERPAPRLLPSIQQSPSSSLSNYNHRGGLAPARDIRSPPAWKPDEIIGVPIPRKARSTSAKRSHEYWFSGDVGVGGEQSHRRPSTSQAGRSIEGAPPSSSSVSAKKKFRPIGPKTRLLKASSKLNSSFSSVQDDIEIEVAEVLYDLMKQSQSKSSKKQEIALHSPVEKFDLKDKIDTGDESRSFSLAPAQTIPHISNLPEDNSSSFTPLLGSGMKRKRAEKVKHEEAKDEDERAEILTKDSSVSSLAIADGEQPTKMETEISSPKLENRGCEEASTNIVTSQAMVEASLVSQKEEVVKQEDKSKPLTRATVAAQKEEVVKQEEKSKPPTQATVAASSVLQKGGEGGDAVLAKEEVAALKEESPKCAELANDPLDSTRTRANSTALKIETKREAKFEIDLMAPPPLASSPDRDGVVDFSVAPKIMAQDVEMKTETVDKMVKNEEVVGALAAKKMETIFVDQEKLKLDLEKPDEDDSVTSGSISLLDQKQQQHSKSTILEGKNSAQSSSLPFPIGTVWSGSLPLGYMSPLQTIMPMGGTTGASPAPLLQPPHFKLFHPRPKRCATHQYIARNIYYHQQFAKTNNIWPAAASITSVYGAKPCNVNVATSAQNMYHGSPSLRGFSGEREQGLVSFSSINGKDKNTEVASIINPTQKKQFLLQRAPQPVPAGNLLHGGPPCIYPMSQHQTAVGTVANKEAGLPKSSTSASNGPLPGSSAIGAPVSSSSLPGTASAVSFNYPNLTANEALPHMAILQNNGYPFSISTHVGMPPPIKGGTHVPAMSFLNGSLYSSPMFHPSQDQTLVQPAHQLTSTSGGSSTSHKQQQSQQSHPAYSSQKHEVEMTTGEDKSLMADKRAQKSTYTQNFAVPIQPMSFALMPPMTLGGRGSKNHGEQHQQQHGIKGGVDLIPPQAFVLSFASFNGSGTASAQNSSSMAQNPAIFQVHPDMARHAYQIAPAAQVVQQKNEGKTGGDSINPDDRTTAILGKSPTSFGQSLLFSKPGCTDPSASVMVGTTVYDSSARTVNFISPVVPGRQPSHSIPTTMKAASVSSNPSNSQQQQQLVQTQKQHMTQQQMHQQQLTGATRIKAQTGNSLPASSVAVKFLNNAPAFSQALMQINSSDQSPQWKNLSRNSTSQVPTSSLAVATTSTLKNVPQQKARTSQGQTQISFGVSSNLGSALHGQQIVSNNQSAAPLVGSPPNSSISRSSGSSSRTASMGSKSGPAISVLPSQPSETSSNGPSQKSSPVCGRNVPSILSTCPSHLSELKY